MMLTTLADSFQPRSSGRKSLLRLFGSYLLCVGFGRRGFPRIPLFWLAITVSTTLVVPRVTFAQLCSANINVGCTNPGAVCKPVTSGVGSTGHCVTPGGLPKGERECACVGTSPPLLDAGCGNRAIEGKINCTIDQPNVTQHETAYPSVLFAPGDIVEVNADGCVQTGGTGNTWKRYVNPSGPNSDRLYHGLIRIPTGTKDSALVRLDTVMAKQLTVTGAGVPLSQLMLSLGYEDDGYSDNGYYAHDDGTEDQCKTDPTKSIDGNSAHVTITIYRGLDAKPDPPSSRFDFDVVSSSLDPNGLPYNPLWMWQQRPENQGKTPNTSMCHNFSIRNSTLGVPDEFMSSYFGDCTDQADTSGVDTPTGINAAVCNFGSKPYIGDTFAGHVNWFPVTVEGEAGWGSHGVDDDYDFTYTSNGEANPLSVNGRTGLHVEFDSDETIDHFSSDDWNAFHQVVDASQEAMEELHECESICTSDQLAQLQKAIDYPKTLFDGYTILTGMFGLDGEHNLKAEIHPVYALATLRSGYENDPKDEVWLMFVRNQGDEGFCSSRIWDAGFEDYTFKLPWHRDGVLVNVNWDKTKFYGSDGTSGPTVSVIPPPSPRMGIYVTFHLGPAVHNSSPLDTPASIPFMDGALHLVWTIPELKPEAPAKAGSIAAQQTTVQTLSGQSSGVKKVIGATTSTTDVDEIEQAIAAAINQLPAAQRSQVGNARVLAGTQTAVVHQLPPTGPVRTITQPPIAATIVPSQAINAGPATQKLARDAAQMKALCAASNNAPTGLPANVCATAVPHP